MKEKMTYYNETVMAFLHNVKISLWYQIDGISHLNKSHLHCAEKAKKQQLKSMNGGATGEKIN